MGNKIILIISIVILALLIKQGHSVRSISFDQVPENYNLLDERTNVWHGLSIRDTGVPAAWSDLRTYWEKWPEGVTEIKSNPGAGLELTRFNISRDGKAPSFFPERNFPELTIFTTEYDLGVETGKRYTSIVQPYLDHPPFGAVILSSLVSSKVTDTKNLTPADFRKSSLWLADLTAILIFIFALQISKNPLIALISTMVYETVPTYLLTSRLALLENVLIPVNLVSLNLLILALNKKREWGSTIYNIFLILAGIVGGLAFLTKTPGISVIISGIIILLLERQSRKKILLFAIPAAIVSSFYFVWGFILAPHVFPKVLVEQSTNRIFVGSLGFIQQLFKYGMTSFPVDGWWVGGFLTMLFLQFNKNTAPLIISIITLFFIIPFTGASAFPWYFIPFIPFASISIGIFFWDILTKPRFLHLLILFFVFFSSSYFWAIGVWGASPDFKNHQQQFLIYKIFLVIFFSLGALAHFYHQKSLTFRIFWFISMTILFILLIQWNFKSIFYILSHWTHLIQNYSPNWVL